MDVPSTGPTTLSVKTGSTIYLAKGMPFAQRKEANLHIENFALAQGKRAITCQAKSGGNNTLYVCASKTNCSFHVQLIKSQRQNYFEYHISSLNVTHEDCRGTVKMTAAQVVAMATTVAAVHSKSALDGPSLQDKVKELEGVHVPTRMMYRVREVLLEDTALDYAEGCKRVQSLLVLSKRGNPTSYIDIEYTADNRFRRAFLSHPDVHLLGETSQAVIGLDGAFLKHKGAANTMLILVGRNGNLENIILADAICPSEDEVNCAWFLRCCAAAGVGTSHLSVFSDRGSGIIAAATSLGINLQYCTRHTIGNMKAKYRGQVTQYVENWVWSVQGAVSKPEFESKIAAFAVGFPDIAKYVSEIEPARWALHQRVLSKKLYGWKTTNFVELENAKALHARGRNPTLFFQYFMEKWMLTKFKRFDQARKWVEAGKKVTPKAKELMSEQAGNARYHEVSLSNDDVGFVRDVRGSPPVRRYVNLLERTCTCSFFYQYGIPCSHIYSMLAFIDQPERIFDFFDRCYLVETYTRANDAATSNIELVLDDHIQADEVAQPPIATPKRGRPRKKRIASQGEAGRSNKQTKCPQCGELGHNRRTCQH